jgi:hypothetical protein
MYFIFKYLFLQKHLVNIFYFMNKNDVLMYILTIYHQKFGCSPTSLPSPLLLSFTAVSDHLKAEEVLGSCGLQYCTALVKIPSSSQSPAMQ